MKVELPWPPSVNHYMNRNGNRSYLSPRAREYRKKVKQLINFDYGEKLINMTIKLYPPDNRKRDIDNYFKQLFDAIQHGGGFKDDNQIRGLRVEMLEKVEGGLVEIEITEILNE